MDGRSRTNGVEVHPWKWYSNSRKKWYSNAMRGCRVRNPHPRKLWREKCSVVAMILTIIVAVTGVVIVVAYNAFVWRGHTWVRVLVFVVVVRHSLLVVIVRFSLFVVIVRCCDRLVGSFVVVIRCCHVVVVVVVVAVLDCGEVVDMFVVVLVVDDWLEGGCER